MHDPPYPEATSATQAIEYAIALYTRSVTDATTRDGHIEASHFSIEVAWGWRDGSEPEPNESWCKSDPILVQVALKVQTSGYLPKMKRFKYQDILGVHGSDYMQEAIARWENSAPGHKATISNYPTPEHLRMEIARRGLFIAIQSDRIAQIYDSMDKLIYEYI